MCLFCVVLVTAQDRNVVKSVPPQTDDIFNVLSDMGIEMFRYDLSAFNDSVYVVEAYVEEYEGNSPTGYVRTFELDRNICSLEDEPEEERLSLRKEHKIPDGENYWENIRDLSIYLRHMSDNDSVAIIRISEPNIGKSISVQLKLHPIDSFGVYMYDTRDFELKKMEHDKDIPLLLYGSWWYEPSTSLFRFCGENEIDVEKKAAILKYIPHYYIIGIRMKKD